ncbi:MAG: sialate O-acetylesterase [Verrucomicrobiae bacterium]|nr:sialate O-acetylesterase [Verrucomicrobiae bacterium]
MRKPTLFAVLVLAGILCSLVSPAFANVKPHGLFTDNMVLQQGRKVPVWGTADEGEKITVEFAGQTVCTTARSGKWMVWLKPLKSGGPFTMTISGKLEKGRAKRYSKSIIKSVLVGEVWICSGQSNMQWSMKMCATPDDVYSAAKDPQLRLVTIPRAAKDKPLDGIPDFDGWIPAWQECGPDSLPDFSAVAYYFGKHLRAALKVPVGLISSNVGGTPAEAWTCRGVLEKQFPDILANHEQAKKAYPENLAKFNKAIEAMKKQGKEIPPQMKRGLPDPAASMQRPCGLYNAMIAPLVPYAIQGAIWYQGESNASRAYQYRTLFPAMIKCWRDHWQQGNFPFLFVQLAPFRAIVTEPVESDWAELREAQLLTSQKVPNTA